MPILSSSFDRQPAADYRPRHGGRALKAVATSRCAAGGYRRTARDVEPEVGKLANAYLYSVDDLQSITFRIIWRSVRLRR